MQPFPHPSDATHKIWSRLAHWHQRYSSLKVWTTDDDGQTTDHWYTISSLVSLWLRWAKNICCGYSLESPRWDKYYPLIIFKYPPYLFWRNSTGNANTHLGRVLKHHNIDLSHIVQFWSHAQKVSRFLPLFVFCSLKTDVLNFYIIWYRSRQIVKILIRLPLKKSVQGLHNFPFHLHKCTLKFD